MRLLLPAFFFTVGATAAIFACSSSDDAKPAATCDGGSCADADTDATSTQPEEVEDAGPSNFSGGGGDGGGAVGGDFDAGTLVTGSDAGTLCLSYGQPEAEDNSVVQAANTIQGRSGTFCGRLESYADNDYVRFTLPGNAQAIHIDVIASEGGLGITASAGGTAFPFPSQTPGDFLFLPGKDYVFGFSSRILKPIDYRLEISIY